MKKILYHDRKNYRTHTLINRILNTGNIILPISIGIQWIITAIMVAGLHPYNRNMIPFTKTGLTLYKPEYETQIYVIGCLLLTGSICIFSWIWHRRISTKTSKIHEFQFQVNLAVWQFLLTVCSGLIYFILLSLSGEAILIWWRQPVNYLYKLIATGIWILILISPGLISLFIYISKIGNEKYKNIILSLKPIKVNRMLVSGLIDLFVIVIIFFAIYIPNWQALTDQIFIGDQMSHWDAFAMRPMLVFKHGLALGRDIYIQYGIGWAMVYTWIDKFWPIAYGQMVFLSIIYTGIFYLGIYFFFKLITKSIIYSIIGITATLYFQFFALEAPFSFHWMTPSATVLRAPMSIWFFIMIYLHNNTRKNRYLYLAGIFLGLSLIFGFDTGIYLLVTFCFYFIILIIGSIVQKKLHELKQLISCSLVSLFIVLTVLNGGFVLASQFRIFHPDFWSGISEGITQFAGGISYVLMTRFKSDLILAEFLFKVGLYIFTIGYLFINLLQKQVKTKDVLMACLGVYGLLSLLIFIGRSVPGNLIYSSIPFWLILVIYINSVHKYVFTYLLKLGNLPKQTIIVMQHGITVCLLLIVILLLVDFPAFRKYPNIYNSYISKNSDPVNQNTCIQNYQPEVCSLVKIFMAEKYELDMLAQKMQSKQSEGKKVAMYDDWDVLFALDINSYPMFRYRPEEIFTQKQLTLIKQQISSLSPEYIITRKKSLENDIDVWNSVHESINSKYILTETTDNFMVWRLKI